MGNHSDGLIVPQAWHIPSVEDLENASFVFNCRVGSLIENPAHVAVAFWGPVAMAYSRTLVITGASAHPGGEVSFGRRGRCLAADSSDTANPRAPAAAASSARRLLADLDPPHFQHRAAVWEFLSDSGWGVTLPGLTACGEDLTREKRCRGSLSLPMVGGKNPAPELVRDLRGLSDSASSLSYCCHLLPALAMWHGIQEKVTVG